MSGFVYTTQQYFQTICFPLAVLTNSILLHLIIFKSPKGFGVYKYLMIYISCFEIVYALLDILLAPDFYSHETMLIVLLNHKYTLFPRGSLSYMSIVFCSMFGSSMAIFAIHFIYRYLVVTGNNFIKTSSFWKMCIWMLSPAIYGIVWGCALFFTMSRDKYMDDILTKHYLPLYDGVKIEDVGYVGPNYYYTHQNGNELINWTALFGMGILMMMVTTSISTIILFAFLCYRKMGTFVKASSNSSQYRNLQLQLLNSLVGQALIPALLMQGPSSIIFIAPFFHKGSFVPGGILGVTISLYPVLDPLPTIIIIKHYRIALLRFCYRLLGKTKKSENVAE